MSNFKNYAEYYDLLYKSKNYQEEADYVATLLSKSSDNEITTVLDLGCGTGKHALLFAKKRYKTTGIDLAEEMLTIANLNKHKNAEYFQGDVRDINLNKEFDAVVSLFHVASYQTTNEDFEKFLRTAFKHLKKGGVFIFDFWYGPAVLTDLPVVRVKRLENEKIKITRISEPDFYSAQNVVNIKFDVQIESKSGREKDRINEVHSMRYWFMPEIEYFAKKKQL